MGENKYSIDEILREASKIRQGQNFEYGYGDSERSETVHVISSSASAKLPSRSTGTGAALATPRSSVQESKKFIAAGVSSAGGKRIVLATPKAADGTQKKSTRMPAPAAAKSGVQGGRPVPPANRTVPQSTVPAAAPEKSAATPNPTVSRAAKTPELDIRLGDFVTASGEKTARTPAGKPAQANSVPPSPPAHTEQSAPAQKEIRPAVNTAQTAPGASAPNPHVPAAGNAAKEPYVHSRKPVYRTPDVNQRVNGKTIEMAKVRESTKIESFSATRRTVDKTIEMDTVGKPKAPAAPFFKPDQPIHAPQEPNAFSPIHTDADYSRAFSAQDPKPMRRNSFVKEEKSDTYYRPNSVVEKAAAIKIDNPASYEKTGDFQAIPTIVSVEEFQNNRERYAPPPKDVSYPADSLFSGSQLTLDGEEFTELDKVEKIDEEVAEEQLKNRRKGKIRDFKLLNLDDNDGQSDAAADTSPIDDYYDPNDRESIEENLVNKKRKVTVKAAAGVVLTVLTGLLCFMRTKGTLPELISDHYVFMSVISAFLMIMLFFNFSTIKNGVKSLFRGKPDFDFPVTAAACGVIAQIVLTFIYPNMLSDGLPLYVPALGFAMICNQLGKRTLLKRVLVNFDFLAFSAREEDHTYTIETIENEKDVRDMSRGLLMDAPVIKKSVRTSFPSHFLEISYKYEPADRMSRKLSPIMLVLSVLTAVITYAVTKDWSAAFTSFVCCTCITIPVISMMATNAALIHISSHAEENNAMVVGFEGARELTDMNAIVINSSDLFPKGCCGHHGWMLAPGVNIVDAILQTAAVLINTNSPLRDVFDKMIVGKQSILPDIDTIIFEEKMGTSAWIYGKKVLVGNRRLLVQHGVRGVPPEDWELKRTKGGTRQLLYLAVDGKMTAVFSVSYTPDPAIIRQLQKLEKSGISILVKSTDPFIDDDMLAEKFETEPGFLRVMNSVSGRIYEKYENQTAQEAPAYAVHDGSALGFISAMHCADALISVKNILMILQIFGCAIGFALTLLFSVYGGIGQITSLQIVLFQAAWSLIMMVFSKLKS